MNAPKLLPSPEVCACLQQGTRSLCRCDPLPCESPSAKHPLFIVQVASLSIGLTEGEFALMMRGATHVAGIDWKMSPIWGLAFQSCGQSWLSEAWIGHAQSGDREVLGHSGASWQDAVGRGGLCLWRGCTQAGEHGVTCRLRVPLLLMCCLSLCLPWICSPKSLFINQSLGASLILACVSSACPPAQSTVGIWR